MSLFELDGTITAIGQSIYDNDFHLYAYIEITDASGVRTLIEKVRVFNDVGALLAQGLTGRFYVDRIFDGANNLRCQLFGVRSDRATVLDPKDLRKRIARRRPVRRPFGDGSRRCGRARDLHADAWRIVRRRVARA